MSALPAANERARARFTEHRLAFERNEPLRSLYEEWYGRVGSHLPSHALGPVVELGSGPGLASGFLPQMLLTDVVRAPWHHLLVAAEDLPFASGTVGALVLFDVLHHLPSPERFFREAMRALAPGGRIVVCDPYISPVSYPVFGWLHEEGFDFSVDPFSPTWPAGKDPFAGNQAVATQLFFRKWGAFEEKFPALRLVTRERFAGLSYPLAGGFGRKPFVPTRAWNLLKRAESWLPSAAFAWTGFRTLVVLERR
ncbi:MAG: class I SAM-dependent methyltransferase [Deltaproteobacteria bacterium]|nr:class I SAM-dependent methyltransferase [Deltaproteobacteria bacterium]